MRNTTLTALGLVQGAPPEIPPHYANGRCAISAAMDPISISASFINLTQVGFQLLKSIRSYTGSVKSKAYSETELLEISIYVEILSGISQIPVSSQATPAAAVPCIQLCHERLEHLKSMNTSSKVKWSSSKDTGDAVRGFMRSVMTLRDIMMECESYLISHHRSTH